MAKGKKFGMKKTNKEFEKEYKDYYLKKIRCIKNKYPEILKKNRRTEKALKNICFFIWACSKEEKNEIVDLMLKASILLSAQDNFFDNSRISNRQKKEFCFICKDVIKRDRYKIIDKSLQFKELVMLWEEIAKEVENVPSYLRDYWQEKAQKLNEAMEVENHILRKREVAFDEYMEIATESVGIMFVWATYFIKKDISKKELQEIKPILPIGAKIVRLSNDLVSYRKNKNRINAINIVEYKKSSEKYILNMIKKELKEFNKKLKKIKIKEDIEKNIQLSLNFLIAFYKISDFS